MTLTVREQLFLGRCLLFTVRAHELAQAHPDVALPMTPEELERAAKILRQPVDDMLGRPMGEFEEEVAFLEQLQARFEAHCAAHSQEQRDEE